MIPKTLLYRIYGESLAVIMNLQQKRIFFLQKEALGFWESLHGKAVPDEKDLRSPFFPALLELGLVERPASFPAVSDPRCQSSPETMEVDMAALTLFAFKNRIPISGHFELTGRCNLRCRHCYCLFRNEKDSLNTLEVFAILESLKKSGVFGLVLTGGEIFMRKDILDILAWLDRERFVIRINTNGTLVDEKTVQTLAGFSNIHRIHVSLYGAEEGVHDAITRSPGSFRKTLRALHLLREAGLDLRINCSVMKSNVDSYTDIATKIGDPMGVPVHFDAEIFPKDDGGTENLAERIETQDLAKFMEKREKKKGERQKLCKAGFSFFAICEDGSLYPCLKMKRFYRNPLGNLKEDAFDQLWHSSEPVLHIRKTLENKLRECDICDLGL